MKIVKQSFEILPEHDDPIKQIAERCRVCYKSEDKAQEDERPFLKRIKKHEPIFEMAVVTLQLKYGCVSHNTALDMLNKNKYIHVSEIISDDGDSILATGSIRAWQELIKTVKGIGLRNIVRALNSYNDFLFNYDQTAYVSKSVSIVADLESLNLSKEDLKLHKHVAVKFITNRAVSHEMVRHRPSSFLQECVAANMKVQSYSGDKKWSMGRLYEMFNDPACGIARKTMRIRTKDHYGEIVPSQILAVMKSGEKSLFEVTTKNGRVLKTSENHIYFTEHGERQLKYISLHDRIWVNGKTVEFDWLYQEYRVKNRERKDIANEIGMSDSWLGKVIRDYGLQKPKNKYPNRQAGHGVKGMHSKQQKKNISERMKGDCNHNWKGGAKGHKECIDLYDLTDELCVCGSPAIERHHIDRNPTNNTPDNIEFCCSKCHHARHLPGVKIAFLDEVISIRSCGKGMTYDIEVDHPAHNFVVEGIVVHNSQRYCRYKDEVVFIDPTAFFDTTDPHDGFYLWESTCQNAENAYLDLLKAGATPQAARTVLPNSCKTELIVYCNLKEWEHILCRRTPGAAEPSMREQTIPLHAEFQKMFPEMFDELQLSVG